MERSDWKQHDDGFCRGLAYRPEIWIYGDMCLVANRFRRIGFASPIVHVMRKWGQPEGHFNAFESLDNEFRGNLQYEATSVHKPTPPIVILLLFFLGSRDHNGFLKRPSGTDRGLRALGLGDHLQRSSGPTVLNAWSERSTKALGCRRYHYPPLSDI